HQSLIPNLEIHSGVHAAKLPPPLRPVNPTTSAKRKNRTPTRSARSVKISMRKSGLGSLGLLRSRNFGSNGFHRFHRFHGRLFSGHLFRCLLGRSLFGGFLGWSLLGWGSLGDYGGLLDDWLLHEAAEFRLFLFALQIVGATAAFDDLFGLLSHGGGTGLG